MKKTLLILFTALLLTACGAKTEPENVIKVGIHGGDSGLAWKHIQEELKKEDITLKIVAFTSYPEPNAALAEKEVDLNAFQHHAYFEKEKEAFSYDLTAIADTYIAPMGAYSSKYESLSEVKDGDKVFIPDDVTNGGRALDLLKANNLIDLNSKEGEIPNLSNVINPKNLDIKELNASNIPGSLDESAFSIINSGIAVDANLDPSKTLFIEQVDLNNKEPFKQYINLIAVRTEDVDNPIIKRIIELYQTDEVKAIVIEDSKGANIPVW